jgi:signal transduction histidine kinase/ActR/RegA family two-component response regulator
VEYTDSHGETMMLASASSAVAGWKVHVQQPGSLLLPRKEEHFLLTGLWALVAFIGCALMGQSIARRVSKPLSQLVATVRALDIGVKVKSVPAPYAPVEVATLLTGFDRMTERLEESFRKHKNALREKEQLNTELADLLATLDEKVKERTRELTEAQQRAEQASNAKSLFLANMSHEIRTPMTGVMGMLAMLSETELNPSQRESVEIAHRSAEAMLELMNAILDLSKIEAGKMRLEQVEFNLPHVVRGAVLPMARIAEDKGLSLDCCVAADADRWFIGDPSRLRQVILNLVANAIKFTRAGSITVSVSVQDTGTRHCALIRVSDTGIGIPSHLQKNIFDAFVQADSSTTRVYGGTGLGLAISKELVELMNGEIRLESAEGAGATFTVSIPLEIAATAAHLNREPDDENLHVVRDCRILVAEDNVVNQRVVKHALEVLGCRVDIAANGLQAIDALRANPYDLVIMDLEMPVMDGYAATREIRRSDSAIRDVPIVALTASVLSGEREQCFAAGMNEFLTKPIRPSDLRRKVTHILEATSDRVRISGVAH